MEMAGAGRARVRPGVKAMMIRFFENEEGQDIIEYALILAFICLAGAAMYVGMTGSQKVLWSATNNQLAAPNGIK
jgi:Flp pilus assembly pilin Flp